jgi:hypothetical protein
MKGSQLGLKKHDRLGVILWNTDSILSVDFTSRYSANLVGFKMGANFF